MSIKDSTLERARGLSTATIHEAAGKTGNLPSFVKPLSASTYLCARAFPVTSPAGDNLFIHHAIYAAQPGDALIVDCSADGREFGYWGEVMTVAAQIRKLSGLVITGGVRDRSRMVEMGFPVFAGNICIRGTGKDPMAAGQIGGPIAIGGVRVRKGDIVIGDSDGVTIIPAENADQIIEESRARDAKEQDIFQRLRAGETTIGIYKLPTIGEKR